MYRVVGPCAHTECPVIWSTLITRPDAPTLRTLERRFDDVAVAETCVAARPTDSSCVRRDSAGVRSPIRSPIERCARAMHRGRHGWAEPAGALRPRRAATCHSGPRPLGTPPRTTLSATPRFKDSQSSHHPRRRGTRPTSPMGQTDTGPSVRYSFVCSCRTHRALRRWPHHVVDPNRLPQGPL